LIREKHGQPRSAREQGRSTGGGRAPTPLSSRGRQSTCSGGGRPCARGQSSLRTIELEARGDLPARGRPPWGSSNQIRRGGRAPTPSSSRSRRSTGSGGRATSLHVGGAPPLPFLRVRSCEDPCGRRTRAGDDTTRKRNGGQTHGVSAGEPGGGAEG
jgi:hypothetical protein